MQHGPGSENAFGGVAQAYGDSVPIVVLPAGYPRKLANVAPNFNSALNYRHIAKWSEHVEIATAVPAALKRAFTQVRNGRPRPVVIEIPGDLFGEDIDLDYEPSFATRSAPDPEAISEVVSVLKKAKKPVIYAGQGVHYAKAWKELKDLAGSTADALTLFERLERVERCGRNVTNSCYNKSSREKCFS